MNNDVANSLVPILEGFFPSVKQLDTKQVCFYRAVRSAFESGQSIDIDGNIGYVFLLAYRSLGKKNKCETIEQLKLIRGLYSKYDKLALSMDQWILDSQVVLGDFESALSSFPKPKVGTRASSSTDSLLSIKFHLKTLFSGEDLLSLFGPKVTAFGLENLDPILQIMNQTLQSNQRHFINIFQTWTQPPYRRPRPYFVFSGSRHSTETAKLRCYDFSLNEDIEHFVMSFTRAAEDRFREENSIPKVWQGWISETALFNFLKNQFEQYEVLQHAKLPWLGRQHLDVFIPALMVAVEFQGEQHQEPIDFFGGEEGFRSRRKLDRRKKRLCKANGVRLIEVEKGYDPIKLLANIKAK